MIKNNYLYNKYRKSDLWGMVDDEEKKKHIYYKLTIQDLMKMVNITNQNNKNITLNIRRFNYDLRSVLNTNRMTILKKNLFKLNMKVNTDLIKNIIEQINDENIEIDEVKNIIRENAKFLRDENKKFLRSA